jgi:hypothetical protein
VSRSRRLLDFASDGGIAGFVRLELRADEGVAWYWAYLVGVPGVPGVVVVRDHEVPLPRQGLEIRGEGLWAELWCETAGEHWTFGLEAFGVRLDAAADALRAGGEIGERVPVGLDLEWETADDGPGGFVHGDVLVGRERFAVEGPGWFFDEGSGEPPQRLPGETLAVVYVPVGDGAHVERRLVQSADGGARWTLLAVPS